MHVNQYPLKQLYFLLFALAVVFVWSIFNDHLKVWLLLSIWVIAGIPLLVITFRYFKFTPIVYTLIFFHACILLVGAHYTYKQTPAGFWFNDLVNSIGASLSEDWKAITRNHFDRLGHFAQGFVPALIAREILIRRSPLQTGKWLFFIVVCICMAISMLYEFTEWLAAVVFKRDLAGCKNAELFLSTQGDCWDTQWDMFMATIGALTSQIILAGRQDKQLAQYQLC